jgi:hypothetical protein
MTAALGSENEVYKVQEKVKKCLSYVEVKEITFIMQYTQLHYILNVVQYLLSVFNIVAT